MGLLQKLKSTLGLDGSRSDRRQERGGDVDVTVEHEPDATAEAAVKGSDDSQVGGTARGDGAESDTTEDAGDAEAGAEKTADESSAGDGVAVDELSGIGATYAERLGEAGIETVADLAGADAERVAADSDIAQSRIERWIERATEY